MSNLELNKEKFTDLFHLILHCGDVIRKERLARSVSQEELSKMANISRSTLSLLERNENVNLFSLRDVIMALKAIDMDDKIIHHVGTNASKKIA